MEEVAISVFKARCLAILEQVRVTGRPVTITRRGLPVATITAPESASSASWLGRFADSATIAGDVLEPVTVPSDWEALRG